MARADKKDFLFIKLHQRFPEHPKALALSDKTFRHLIELWCYCSRNLTDGIVPKEQVRRIVTAKTKRELIENDWMIEHQNSFEMLNYLEHQQSREQVERRRATAQANGAQGGRPPKKRNPVGNPMGSESETQTKADIDIDTDIEKRETSVSLFPDGDHGDHPDDRFEEFWDAFDRKVEKPKAREQWKAALKKPGVNASLLIEAARQYIDWQCSEGKHPRYTVHPHRWLRDERWGDERVARRSSQPQSRVQQHLALAQQLAAEQATIHEIGGTR